VGTYEEATGRIQSLEKKVIEVEKERDAIKHDMKSSSRRQPIWRLNGPERE